MSPLTHLPAPAPTRAIHAAEVLTASEAFAERMLREYLDTLLWRLWYPHTRWRTGQGQAVSGTTATVTLNPHSEMRSAGPAAYTIGSGPTYTTAGIRDKTALLALNVKRRGPHEPVADFQNWFDGLVVSLAPPALPQPPPPSEPVAPAGTLTPATFRARAQTGGTYASDLLTYYIRKRARDEWWPVTRVWAGVVQSVDIPNKRATVALDALPASGDTPTVTCGFGWRKWSAAQLVGKHVRVMFDGVIGMYVDDTNP